MPNYKVNLDITTGRGDKLSAIKSGNYKEVFSLNQDVDNITTFTVIFQTTSTKGVASFPDAELLLIKNNGIVGAELLITSYGRTNATPDGMAGLQNDLIILGAGDFIFLPTVKKFHFDSAVSGGDAYSLTNQVPDSNMYSALNNVAAGDAQLLNEDVDSGAETAINVDEGAYFFEGDLIRLENEICEVVSISSNTITVIRGVHGSTKATHADDVAIRLPFFNAHGGLAFDRYSVSQTNKDGAFTAMNFFGYGRNTDGSGNRMSNGIVAGSISGKFYNQGYQNMTDDGGITSNTNSGLSASTTYYLSIAQDGGTTDKITFTTDSSNVNFGGTNGIISKLQSAVDALVYDPSKHGFEDGAMFSIVGGNLRCTSRSNLSTSAISITTNTDGTSGTDELFDTSNVIGRFPATIPSAVASKLPPDTILNKKSGVSIQNIGHLFYDDGHGNIKGKCNGSINYTTGAITLLSAPPNAEFVISANYGSAHSGGVQFGSAIANSIHQIKARSCNQKIDTLIEVIGLH